MPTPPLLPNEIASSVAGRVQVRAEPLHARWTLADLITADNHRLRATFTCGFRPLPDAAEKKLLAETFLARKSSATIDDLVAHFAPALRAAALATASSKAVADWLADNAKEALVAPLRQAADTVAFACGLEVLPPFQLEIESPSFQQQRLEAMERNLAQQRVAGQVEHFEKAAALLKQYDALRHAAPGITPGAVLQQISPSDQGVMLQTLLLAAGKDAAAKHLWAVAGESLVRIDARTTPPQIQLFPLPTTVGPLRSVQAAEIDGRPVLLVGARSGVLLVNVAAPDAGPEIYHHAANSSQMGFNRAVIWRHGIWASHAEAGIVAWDLGVFAQPKSVTRPASAPFAPPQVPTAPSYAATSMVSMESQKTPGARNLTPIDDARLIFSVGARLFTIDAESQLTPVVTHTHADVIAILPTSRALCIVHDDGALLTLDPQSLAIMGEQRRGSRTLAATLLPWLGSARLVLATDAGPLVCLGTDDPLVTEYLSAHRGLRLVAATATALAALSADRSRLVLWQPWNNQKPAAELPISSLARHRIGDITFG